MSKEEKIKQISYSINYILKDLGLDTGDPNLKGTPVRVAKMYVNEFFRGLNKEDKPKITFFPNGKKYNQIIQISFSAYSYCAHHLLPFRMRIHFAYIPDEKVVGLSKIPRVIDWLAAKPHLQEDLTEEIVAYFENELKPKGVMCFIDGEHECVMCRGVKKINSKMRTSAIRGAFEKKETRDEFFQMIRGGGNV